MRFAQCPNELPCPLQVRAVPGGPLVLGGRQVRVPGRQHQPPHRPDRGIGMRQVPLRKLVRWARTVAAADMQCYLYCPSRLPPAIQAHVSTLQPFKEAHIHTLQAPVRQAATSAHPSALSPWAWEPTAPPTVWRAQQARSQQVGWSGGGMAPLLMRPAVACL